MYKHSKSTLIIKNFKTEYGKVKLRFRILGTSGAGWELSVLLHPAASLGPDDLP